MKARVVRGDFSYLVSAVLLVVAVVVAVTGLASDLWDLNDFVYHKYAGYVLAVLALAHVYLHWDRLVSYTRWRLAGHPKRRRVSSSAELNKREVATASEAGGRTLLARRTAISMLLGGLGGFALGRFLNTDSDLPYGGDVGAIYHEWSKPKLTSLLGAVSNWGQSPPLYKAHAGAERIDLPPPDDFRGLVTEEAIRHRRSKRNFSDQTMTLEELSRLLFYTGGITTSRWSRKLRAAPSAGALYPVEIYPVIHRVEDLKPGLYHYAVEDHALELLQADDLRGEIVKHGLMQDFLGQANLVLVFTAIFQRLRWKYQERSYRYALLEAGHMGQNAYLAATSMGCGVCAVGAFLDDGLNNMLGVDGEEEAAIYMLAAGKV